MQKFQILLTFSEGNPVEEYFIECNGVSAFGAFELFKQDYFKSVRMVYCTKIIINQINK